MEEYNAMEKFDFLPSFNEIKKERRNLIEEIAIGICERMKEHSLTHLLFVCTHNSRRSQVCELWATTFIDYFHLDGLQAHSCGTEKTAFNYRMINAARKFGFECVHHESNEDEAYTITPPSNQPSLKSYFSKKFGDPALPTANIVAIMTCDHASENCPIVPGADQRWGLEYVDPGNFDGHEDEAEHYSSTFKIIGAEMALLFRAIQKSG